MTYTYIQSICYFRPRYFGGLKSWKAIQSPIFPLYLFSIPIKSHPTFQTRSIKFNKYGSVTHSSQKGLSTIEGPEFWHGLKQKLLTELTPLDPTDIDLMNTGALVCARCTQDDLINSEHYAVAKAVKHGGCQILVNDLPFKPMQCQ